MNEIRRRFSEIVSVDVCDHRRTGASDAWKEVRLRFNYHPIATIQMLAWGQSGALPDGTTLVCTDWDSVTDEMKGILRCGLEIAAERIITAQLSPNSDGEYTIRHLETLAKVQDDGIHVRLPLRTRLP